MMRKLPDTYIDELLAGARHAASQCKDIEREIIQSLRMKPRLVHSRPDVEADYDEERQQGWYDPTGREQ